MDKNEYLQYLLAECSYDSSWAGWMKYMLSCGTLNDDGTWTMPKEKVNRWQRQMTTKFADLRDEEQKSDY